LKSFLFTLKNPHNFPAKRFGLKEGMRCQAIYCNSTFGPDFHDIGIDDHCYVNYFGLVYINDTVLDGETFFTGSEYLNAKEIEVFEITN
jgi:hypothetical protein